MKINSRAAICALLAGLWCVPGAYTADLVQNLDASNATGALFQPAALYFHVPDTSTQNSSSAGQDSSERATLAGAPRNLVRDQGRLWTSPTRIRRHDLVWLLPLGVGTAALIATDRHTAAWHANTDRGVISTTSDISSAGLALSAAIPVSAYGMGLIAQNEHAREAGLLGMEAMVDSLAFGTVVKLVTQRARPYQDIRGRFWNAPSWTNASFPSNHALLTWAAASVISQEYPNPLARWGMYGLAVAVSGARIAGEQHFPSDVVVGAAAGFLIGRLVYALHHHRGPASDAAH